MIPPDLARSLDYETLLPLSDPVFTDAVRGTPAAALLDDGLLLQVVRYQKPHQGLGLSVRTGVFYLPVGSAAEKHYRGASKKDYGGEVRIQGPTLLRRPFFVKGSTGGAAPKQAYDQLKGKGAYENLRDEMIFKRCWVGTWPKHPDMKGISSLLMENGADPSLAFDILDNSRESNQLVYAILENIVAHAVRDAGYDSVLGWSRTRAGEPFFSEIFDLREGCYPTDDGEFSLYHGFQMRPPKLEISAELDALLDRPAASPAPSFER